MDSEPTDEEKATFWNWRIPEAELCGSCDGKPAPVAGCEECHGTGRTVRVAQMCDHCGYEAADPDWFETLPKRLFGAGIHSQQDLTLCRFCMESIMVSAWMNGLNREGADLARDLMAGLNLLRRELKRDG